jgi:hypothetical protein
MPLNKTTDYIIDRVIDLLATVDGPKYPNNRPVKNPPVKFFVVNGFCTVPGIMQKFVINVNCHAKNISGNMDRSTLDSMSVAVLNILEEYDSPGELIIEFESQETISEANADEHYSNLRFTVKSINN